MRGFKEGKSEGEGKYDHVEVEIDSGVKEKKNGVKEKRS